MNILLANPRGFCAGVDRAIEIVERALDTFGDCAYQVDEQTARRQFRSASRDVMARADWSSPSIFV